MNSQTNTNKQKKKPIADRKRPAFRFKPFERPCLWKKASSTLTLLSGASATLICPEKYGSILEASVSSDSPKFKLRLPGPTSSPLGKNPCMRNFFVSCDRLA